MPELSPNRLARGAFVAHLALIAFSSLAMVTVLNGAPGPWLTSEPNATVMRIAWAWSGPTYVVLGALTALWHAGGRIGVRRALAIFAIASLVSLGAELTGTSTGLPFGDYKYTPLLGWRVFGLVPFPIPISWFYMLYCCLAMLGRFIPAADDRATRWRWAALAGLVLVAWDVSMDPAMVKTSHWLWGAGRMFTELGLPAWLVAFFTKDIFYGMPLSNWFGWYLTGTLIAWLMLAVVSPTTVARSVSPSRLPIWLYATNGIMPVVLCLRDGMWWAAGLGAIAMAIPVGLALRGGPQRSGATVAPRVTAAI